MRIPPAPLAALLAGLSWSCALSAAPVLTFEKDVRPILKTHCFHCHGEDNETKGGLDVRLTRFILKGGKSGPAIKPGKPAESHLLELVKNAEMPKGKGKLSDAQIETLEQWIAQGAKTARPEPEKLGPEFAFTDEERAWWAFQPVRKVSPAAEQGTAANPIDRFIAAKLKTKGLSFSEQADAVTLIRRLSYDLTGLPPSPEEVAAFEKAFIANPQTSVEQLIERLMSLPAYGERWGRHWLDVAGYADSDGYTDKDTPRANAWKYRDYVIRAFNTDKPFDQFVREQLAGDEMVKQPYRNLTTEDIEKITATGFLRMAADGTASVSDTASKNATIADTIKIIGTSLYGMTIACAQCHDHRYDPITQADYYRMRAIFEPGFDTKNWRSPAARQVSLLTEAQRAEAARIEAEAKKLDAAYTKQQQAFIDEVLEKEIAKAPADQHDALRKAYTTAIAKRTPDQTKLLKAWPRINQLSTGSLYLYDTTYQTKHAQELKDMAAVAAKLRATKPVEEFLQAFTEVPQAKPETIPATFIFHRGDPEQPKEKVNPGDLSILAGQRPIEIAPKSPALPSSGRRLAFANAITDGTHPLLARVMVNRVWMHHFGKGLVASAGDFGRLGELPSHPELLDWLAADFMSHGWSVKRLHRQILTSRTWQQTSRRDAERERIDPDNRLLSRMSVQRLDAETLRDSFLTIAGTLKADLGGKPVPVMHNTEGLVVLGIDTTDTAGRQTGKYISMEGQDCRRSLYVQARRSMPLEMFATFDAPAMTDANCTSRPVTTVSPQSLLLMNNLYMREHAQDFAKRLQRECGNDLTRQVQRAWQLCYQSSPSMADEAAAIEFVNAQTKHYETHPTKLDRVTGPVDKADAPAPFLGLTALCHALLSSNGLLYVD